MEWIRDGNNFRKRERREEERRGEISVAAEWSGFGTEIISEKEKEEKKREEERFLFLSSSLLSLTLSFSSSLSSSPARLYLSLSRRKFPSRGEISFSLFFSSFSHSLLFLTFFLARASLSLSLSLPLATEISVARRNFFFSLLLFFLSLSPSLPHFLPRLRVSLSLSRRKFPSRGEISFSLFSLFLGNILLTFTVPEFLVSSQFPEKFPWKIHVGGYLPRISDIEEGWIEG